MNTNSAAEFGNKVQSCVTEDAKIFYCYIGWNLYVEDRVEYFSVFLVAAISATVPASIIFSTKSILNESLLALLRCCSHSL